MRLALSLLLATAAASPLWAEPVPQLKPGENWLAVASTQDKDTAIGIAQYYRWYGARVVSSQSGWFAVVLGPYKANSIEGLKSTNPDVVNDLPKDALFSRGSKYVEQVWRVEPAVGDNFSASYAPDKPARFSAGPLQATVSISGDEENPGPTTLEGTVDGKPAFTFTTSSEFSLMNANAALLQLDPGSEYPQLVATRFTGGAHCCTQTWIVTKPGGSAAWSLVEGAYLDGDGYGYRDEDGDGRTELAAVDNRFLYAFDSYAGSFAPTRYYQLHGARLDDVTETPAMKPVLRRDLATMEYTAKLQPDVRETNGYLAGWVALKVLVGEGDDAWAKAMQSYQKESDFGPQICSTGEELDKCPSDKLVAIPFPKALAGFLRDSGYLPLPAEAAKELE